MIRFDEKMFIVMMCIFMALILETDTFPLDTKTLHKTNSSFYENWNSIKLRPQGTNEMSNYGGRMKIKIINKTEDNNSKKTSKFQNDINSPGMNGRNKVLGSMNLSDTHWLAKEVLNIDASNEGHRHLFTNTQYSRFKGHRVTTAHSIPTRVTNQKIKNYLPATGSSSRVVLEHPTKPMTIAAPEIFKINRPKHPNCQLKEDMYHVKMEEDRQMVQGKLSTIVAFTAAVGWISGENKKIASSSCSRGWIITVDVEPWARGCGIGTVLTELCFMDPEVNNMHERSDISPNRSLFMLGNYPDTIGHVKEYCNALMGMMMLASGDIVPSYNGAYAYFNAALRQGYNRMLIFSQYQIHYLWVQDAKRLFQSNPNSPWRGWIGNEFEGCPHCSNCGAIPAHGHEWFFCKDT